jgi:hypothetical protein
MRKKWCSRFPSPWSYEQPRANNKPIAEEFSSVHPFLRLRQNTPRLAAGMNGEGNYGAIPLDTPPLAVGSFI